MSNYSAVDAIMESASFFSLLAVFWCLVAVVLLLHHQLSPACNEPKRKQAEKHQPLDVDIERYLGRLLDLDAPSLNIPLLPVEAALRIINDYAEAPIATGFPEVDSALQQARAMHVMVETTRHSAAQLAHLEAQGGPVASDELFKQVAKAVVDKHHEDTKENIRFMQPFCESSWRKPSAVRSFPKQFACRSDANLASIDGRGGIHAQAERALRKGRPFWDLFC